MKSMADFANATVRRYQIVRWMCRRGRRDGLRDDRGLASQLGLEANLAPGGPGAGFPYLYDRSFERVVAFR